MNKSSLIRDVAMRTGYGAKEVREIVDETLASVLDSVSRGDEVTIYGFGRFFGRTTMARRQPLLGVSDGDLKERLHPLFRPSPRAVAVVNNGGCGSWRGEQ